MTETSTSNPQQTTDTRETPAASPAVNGAAARRKLYGTRAEAEANKPSDATKYFRVYDIAKNGATVGAIWANGYDNALAGVAKLEGYSASTGIKTAPITREAVAAKLAELTDEELAAMGLSRKKAKK